MFKELTLIVLTIAKLLIWVSEGQHFSFAKQRVLEIGTITMSMYLVILNYILENSKDGKFLFWIFFN